MDIYMFNYQNIKQKVVETKTWDSILSSDQFHHLHTNFLFYHNQYFVTLKAEVRIHILLSTSCKIKR